MNAFTKLSEKGQVVVPKALRDRKGWPAGTDLEVIDAGDGVLLRRRTDGAKRLTVDEALVRLRRLYIHQGPPVPAEQLGWAIDIDDEGR